MAKIPTVKPQSTSPQPLFGQMNWVQYLAGTAIVIVTIAACYSYGVIRRVTLESLKQNAFLEVQNGANEIDRWLATLKAQTEAIANTPTVQTLDWSTIEPYFLDELNRTYDPFKLSLIGNDGYLVANTSAGRSRKDLRHRAYLQEVMQGKTFVSNAVVSPTTGVTQVLVSTPIWSQAPPTDSPENAPDTFSRNPSILGAVNNAVTIDLVSEVVSALEYGAQSYAFVLNSDGRAMVHPDTQRMSTQEEPAASLLDDANADLAAIAQQMVDQQAGIELRTVDGQAQYIAYLPMQEANWSIALIIPKENIEQQLQPLDLIAFALGTLALSLVIVFWRVQAARQRRLRQNQAAAIAANRELEKRVQERTLELAQAKDQLEVRVQERTRELAQAVNDLKQAQLQMVQSEKMSALGQLVAGVAHEINNPVSFIHGNLEPAKAYVQDVLSLLGQYQQYYPQPHPDIQRIIEEIDLEFLQTDFVKLLQSIQVGTDRIQAIVNSLRNFSRLDESTVKAVDIHEGLDSTLTILQTRLRSQDWRAEIQVIKEYGEIPLIECYAGQLNQVFINILSNSIDALEEQTEAELSRCITIRTAAVAESVVIKIQDNGPGMNSTTRDRLFDPFFTTKPVGKGTGLGLSISYQIITEKHGGTLTCNSFLGGGALFTINLPIALRVAQD
ncbi:MAG: ATP-binding protein [Cyanobacteria bacterium P01_G01_bin.54]